MLHQVLTSGVTATGGQLILAQLMAASAADTLGSTALCPLEATRIRMVVLPGYSTSFPDAFRRLNAEEGLDGLFGTLPAVLVKQVPYTALQLVTYDQVMGYCGPIINTGRHIDCIKLVLPLPIIGAEPPPPPPPSSPPYTAIPSF